MNEEKNNLSKTETEESFSHIKSHLSAPAPEEKKDSWLDILKFVLITVAIVLPIRFFIAQPFLVSGPSMDPTFHNNDYLIVDEISYRFENPKRGEVVIFKRAGEKKYLIKRIIGLPGDTLVLEGDKITITNDQNPKGFTLDQSFVVNQKSEPKLTVILDGADYFVLGDNRPLSFDSRHWGVLPQKQIVGRPLIRLYPFDKMGFFPGDQSRSEKLQTTNSKSQTIPENE